MEIKDIYEDLTPQGYWLLDVVVRDMEPLRALVSEEDATTSRDDYYALMFNRKDPGFNTFILMDTLSHLFRHGFLFAQWSWKRRYHPMGAPFIPSMQQLEAAITHQERRKSLWYGLSEQGGRAWETLSHPDWNKYMSYVVFPDTEHAASNREPWAGNSVVEITSANKTLVEKYLSIDMNEIALGIPGSEAWNTLTPWQATYWKSLPEGYQVRYAIYREEEWEQQTTPDIQRRVHFRSDPDMLLPPWYTRYE